MIGIIGLGFVGNAIKSAHEFENKVCIDIDPVKATTGTYDQLNGCDAVFVCVPSPMQSNGECNTYIFESVLDKLKEINFTNPIISKVTAPPQVYTKWSKLLPNLVYSPEFLTAANAVKDYQETDCIIVGGTVKAFQREAAHIIGQGLKKDCFDVYYCTMEEASLMKYTINSFLATKVSFMNEIYRVAQNLNIDYNKLVYLIGSDGRIGDSHMQVPGPDGKFGYGGMCFPKDTSALTHFAGVDMPILKEIIKQNDLIREV